MCKCKKALKYSFALRWSVGDAAIAPHWHVRLDGTCTRCNAAFTVRDATVGDEQSAKEGTDTTDAIENAMQRLLPKGIERSAVKLRVKS